MILDLACAVPLLYRCRQAEKVKSQGFAVQVKLPILHIPLPVYGTEMYFEEISVSVFSLQYKTKHLLLNFVAGLIQCKLSFSC